MHALSINVSVEDRLSCTPGLLFLLRSQHCCLRTLRLPPHQLLSPRRPRNSAKLDLVTLPLPEGANMTSHRREADLGYTIKKPTKEVFDFVDKQLTDRGGLICKNNGSPLIGHTFMQTLRFTSTLGAIQAFPFDRDQRMLASALALEISSTRGRYL